MKRIMVFLFMQAGDPFRPVQTGSRCRSAAANAEWLSSPCMDVPLAAGGQAAQGNAEEYAMPDRTAGRPMPGRSE